jgi:hypothetical protein
MTRYFRISGVFIIACQRDWDVKPCGSCKDRRFGGTYASFIRVIRIGEQGTTLAVTSNRRRLQRNTKFIHNFRGWCYHLIKS